MSAELERPTLIDRLTLLQVAVDINRARLLMTLPDFMRRKWRNLASVL